MIEAISVHTQSMGFGLNTCPHCGKTGLSSTQAPCPSCGGTVDTATQTSGQSLLPGMPSYSIHRGDDENTRSRPKSLEEELREEQEARLRPDHIQEHSPRSAATAMEAGMHEEEKESLAAQGASADSGGPESENAEKPDAADKAAAAAAGVAAAAEDLNAEELEVLRELQERDREVRSHEQAHISAGGSVVTGGASYTFETGPDGRQYAVGGEVGIDASPVPNNPEATMDKARTIRRAAMAPASPSAQDQKVASQAAQMEAEARLDKAEEERAENTSAAAEQGLPGAAVTPSQSTAGASSIAGGRLDEDAAMASLAPSSAMPAGENGAQPHKAVHEIYTRQQQAGAYGLPEKGRFFRAI